MKWDSKYVRGKYKVHMLGQHGIYFPCEKAKRLLVLFSSMGKDRYDRYSWFWQEDEHWAETAYLFLKDDSFNYFLGDDEKPLTQTFRKIILHHMVLANVKEEQVFTVGGSMGGYAAIYYASLMQLNGAIVSNPQLDMLAHVPIVSPIGRGRFGRLVLNGMISGSLFSSGSEFRMSTLSMGTIVPIGLLLRNLSIPR